MFPCSYHSCISASLLNTTTRTISPYTLFPPFFHRVCAYNGLFVKFVNVSFSQQIWRNRLHTLEPLSMWNNHEIALQFLFNFISPLGSPCIWWGKKARCKSSKYKQFDFTLHLNITDHAIRLFYRTFMI